jgi:methyl-accepting chemotaxis protein
MDLSQAVVKHSEWKIKFVKAMASKEKLDALTISRDNCCELGKWLHGEAKGKYAALPGYRACVAGHATFHVEAAKVAMSINAGRFEEASGMMNAGKPYAKASSAVGSAIMQLKTEAGL